MENDLEKIKANAMAYGMDAQLHELVFTTGKIDFQKLHDRLANVIGYNPVTKELKATQAGVQQIAILQEALYQVALSKVDENSKGKQIQVEGFEAGSQFIAGQETTAKVITQAAQKSRKGIACTDIHSVSGIKETIADYMPAFKAGGIGTLGLELKPEAQAVIESYYSSPNPDNAVLATELSKHLDDDGARAGFSESMAGLIAAAKHNGINTKCIDFPKTCELFKSKAGLLLSLRIVALNLYAMDQIESIEGKVLDLKGLTHYDSSSSPILISAQLKAQGLVDELTGMKVLGITYSDRGDDLIFYNGASDPIDMVLCSKKVAPMSPQADGKKLAPQRVMERMIEIINEKMQQKSEEKKTGMITPLMDDYELGNLKPPAKLSHQSELILLS